MKGSERPHLLVVENLLGVVHRRLWTAAMEAENLADQSLANDLHQLHEEVRRIHESLVGPRLAGLPRKLPRA